MSAHSPLRAFFEQELLTADGGLGQLGQVGTLPIEHVVSHLTEQTLRRAALDAATQRYALEHPSGGTAEVSWKHCLMVAALTELRPVKLLARN